jgi:hypothetical protein
VARYVWSFEAHNGFFISLLAVIRPGEQGAEADKFRLWGAQSPSSTKSNSQQACELPGSDGGLHSLLE